MNELEIAKKLIEDANVMIAERDQHTKDANTYRNVIRHDGDNNGTRTSRMERLKKETAQLQEQIDYNLAFAENILERAADELEKANAEARAQADECRRILQGDA